MWLSDDSLVQPRTARQRWFPALERLVGRAISDHQFAAQLLHAPERASADLTLALSTDEQALVASVRNAQSVEEFAARLFDGLVDAHEGGRRQILA